MKNVTQGFIDAQNKHALKYYREINMYRRYWAGSGYTWETEPVDLIG